MKWHVALPMYALTAELRRRSDALLRALIEARRQRGWCDKATIVEPHDLLAHWRDPALLLSQTCGYPLLTSLASQVQLVATPHYDVAGCDGPFYASAIIVNAESQLATLADCRGKVAAVNTHDSQSGMNAFRHAVAPLASDGKFFGDVIYTKSHLASVRAVGGIGELRADVAAIDPVSLALIQEHFPEAARRVRTIAATARAPGLPLICSKQVSKAVLLELREDLKTLLRTEAALLQSLRIREFSFLTLDDYRVILDYEHEAQRLGYPVLR